MDKTARPSLRNVWYLDKKPGKKSTIINLKCTPHCDLDIVHPMLFAVVGVAVASFDPADHTLFWLKVKNFAVRLVVVSWTAPVLLTELHL